jgi:Transposase DDE domain
MVAEGSVLVALVRLVDRIPRPPPPPKHRGRPRRYPDRLFLKALVIMVVRHVPKVQTLLSMLDEPTTEMAQLRGLLSEQGRFPSRRTWERRLRAIPETLPAQIGCLGRHLVTVLVPWPQGGQAAAIDSTVLAAHGGVWHKQHREAGVVPHSSIDTEAGWTKSGWHGWVYGWKLHLVTTVAAVWLPLAATLTPANRADNEEAPALVAELPEAVHFLLGDTAYNDPDLRERCAQAACELVPSKRGRYPHTDGGVEVRRIFHQLRSHAIENLNGQFKDIFDCQGQVPTRGLLATQRYVLGAVFVYQLTLLYRFEIGGDLRVGLKAFLRAA